MDPRSRAPILVLLVVGLLIAALRVALDTILVEALATAFYLVVPGALLLLNLTRLRDFSIGAACVLSVSLSVSFLMLGSFLCNQILPILGVLHPLASGTLTIGIDSLLLLLFAVTYWRKAAELPDLAWFRRRLFRLDKMFVCLFAILPAQAVAGALLLNNGLSNTLAIATGIEAVVLIAAVFGFRRRLNVGAMYPLALFSVSCTILLMVSVRSTNVFGWDINQELYVLQLTNLHGRWMPTSFLDAYNTCLSITTFPAALSALTGIDSTWLLKLIYPVLFAFSSLALYKLFASKFAKTWAYLAVLVVIAQPQYMAEMTMLARQEIALLFVATAYLVLFAHRKSNATGDKILFLIMTSSIIVSHYSTSYIFILTLCGMYIWKRLMMRRQRKRRISTETVRLRSFLSLGVLIACVIIALAWNVQFSAISSNIHYVAMKIYSNLGSTLTSDLRSGSIASSIWSLHRQDPATLLQRYVQAVSQQTGGGPVGAYAPHVKVPHSIPGVLHATVGGLRYAYPALSTLLKLCLVFGVVAMLRSRKRDQRTLLLEGAVVSYTVGIGAFLILPYISLAYNFERFVQQALFVLAVPILLGLGYFTSMFRRLRASSTAICLTVIILYWLFPLGLSAELLGGQAAVQYHNYGLYYSSFYAHDQEVAALHWLGSHSTRGTSVYADIYASTRLLPYTHLSGLQIKPDLVPPLSTGSYIFASYTNSVDGITFGSVGGDDLTFTFPTDYLSARRNLVYSNGYSGVYR